MFLTKLSTLFDATFVHCNRFKLSTGNLGEITSDEAGRIGRALAMATVKRGGVTWDRQLPVNRVIGVALREPAGFGNTENLQFRASMVGESS